MKTTHQIMIHGGAVWLALGCACAPAETLDTTTSPPQTARAATELRTVFSSPPTNIHVLAEPLNNAGELIYEPVARTSLEPVEQYLINGHVDIRNDRSTTLQLERAIFRPSTGAAQDWNEAELLAEQDSKPYRARLGGGGWARLGHQADVAEDGLHETLHAIDADGTQTFAAAVRRDHKNRFGVIKYNSGGERTATKNTFGSWSQAGAYGLTHHGSRVVAVGGVANSAAYFAMARFNESLELDNTFSGDGRMRFGMPGCGDEALLDVVRVSGAYLVAGRGTCSGRTQGAVARITSSGSLDSGFHGDGQVKLGFWTSDVEAVGLAVFGSWAYVAGNIGTSCDPFANTAKSCSMFVARLNVNTGAIDTSFGNVGGYRIISGQAGEARGASAIAVDASGRPVVTGWTINSSGESWLTTARLRTNGALDSTFHGTPPGGIACNSCGGVLEHKLSGYDAVGRDLVIRSDNTIAIAASVRTPVGGQDFGLAVLNSAGWLSHDANAFHGNGGAHTYNIPAGMTEDSLGRLIMAGRANHFVWATGSDLAASAAFLADGLLAKRTNIGPGESRKLYLHMPRFDSPAAASAEIDLRFNGLDPLVRTYALRAHDNGSAGSYPFPARQEDLPADAYWTVGNEHMLGHNHVWSGGQRYAIDFSAVRYGSTGWTDRIASAETKAAADIVNSDKVIWGMPVYAIDGGYVRECYRTVDENPIGEKISGGGGNMFYIDHDSGETVLYAHLQDNSVPASLCANEGVQPGPTYPRIEAGTRLGLVGNTGSSTGPHLHIDAQTGYDAYHGVPLLFHDIDVHHRTWPLTAWLPATAKGLTRASGETSMLVRPRSYTTEPYCDATGHIVNGTDHGALCGTRPAGPCADLAASSYRAQWLNNTSGMQDPRWHPNGNDSFHTRCDYDSDTGAQMSCVREGQGPAVCKICGHGPSATHTELGCRPTGTCPAGTQLWPDGRCWDVNDDLPEWMCQADCETMYNGQGYCLNNIDWRMMMEDVSLTLSSYSWKVMPYNYYEPMCASFACDGDGVACAAAGLSCDPDPGNCIDECWSDSDCASSNPPPAYPSSFICTNARTCRL